jgi:tellurite resistance protein
VETFMTETEQKALITVALLAAFADGNNNDSERAEVKRIAESLSRDSNIDISAIYQDVLLRRTSVGSAVAGLASSEARNLAFELAVCVCDIDGAQVEAERAFLSDLRSKL